MHDADPDRDPLDLLAEEFADRCRRGETPAVSEYVEKYPYLALELRDLLPAVAQIELLKKVRKPAAAALPEVPPPERLGDFRIIREIGRGGMGVVYEAVQESLDRRVALKLLPAHARLDPAKRERFLRESQAAARLHHTNIVPVFGVGEANGIPYYVMQYIPGCGLHDVIAGWRTVAGGKTTKKKAAADRDTVPNQPPARPARPVELPPARALPKPGQWKAIARIGLAAARALQEAHEQGVLHRDVKPGNLLLDRRGHVWVTDFGLAKVVDRNSLTATGDVMGTIPYMAPEALHGQADARTDIYGLGMTLYELVAGRLPFDDSNPAVLVKQIEAANPPPPRRANPGVPRDLETIILTAIAREPNRRYRTAADFAADLAAFVNDRPIRARRVTTLGRAWWACRRNPVVAGLSAFTAAVFVAAAVFGWVMFVRTKTALGKEAGLRADAEAARTKEADERAKADAANAKLTENLKLSFEAFEKVFAAVGELDGMPPPRPGGPGGFGGPRPGGPGADLAKDKMNPAVLLEPILESYDKFAERNAANPQLRFDAARAYRTVGNVHFHFGRPEKAEAAFLRAVALLADLSAEFADNPAVAREVVLAHSRLSPVTDPKDAAFAARLASFRKAGVVADALRRKPPGGPHPVPPMAYADLYHKLGDMFAAAGELPEARKAHDTARAFNPGDGFGRPGPDRPPRRP